MNTSVSHVVNYGHWHAQSHIKTELGQRRVKQFTMTLRAFGRPCDWQLVGHMVHVASDSSDLNERKLHIKSLI